jgi:hypothetical protein
MDPSWYKIRLVVTLVTTGIGALLLWAAYAVADDVTRAVVDWMVLLGLAIPTGFFALFTLAGWQRGSATGARPNIVIAWCNDHRRYPLLWVGFVVFLSGVAQQIVIEIRRGDTDRAALQASEQTVQRNLGDACYAHADQVIGTAAPAGIGLNLRVPYFCTCLDIEVEKAYTPQQFADVPKERWWQGDDKEIDLIMHRCRLYDSSVVRVLRRIREGGGDPDSTAIRPKILNYAACVNLELQTGYPAAELMQLSADPAWQDDDTKFRQIVAKCLKYAGWTGDTYRSPAVAK